MKHFALILLIAVAAGIVILYKYPSALGLHKVVPNNVLPAEVGDSGDRMNGRIPLVINSAPPANADGTTVPVPNTVPPTSATLMADNRTPANHRSPNPQVITSNVDHLDPLGNWSGGPKTDGLGNWSGGPDPSGVANWTATEPRFGGSPDHPLPTAAPTGNWTSGGRDQPGTANWTSTEPQYAPSNR